MRSTHLSKRWMILIAIVVGLADAGIVLLRGDYGLAFAQPARHHASVTLKGDAAHPAHGQHWVDTRLYFGLGPADAFDKGVPESVWREFLDREVTPRFPAGLSVMDVYGQWQGKQEKPPERIRSKELIIDYPSTAANAAKVEAIRAAWKQKTGDHSVMKVTQPANVSF
jgi:hypothetical protein